MKQIKDNYVFTSFEVSKQLDKLKSFQEFTSEYHDYYYNKNGEVIDAETITAVTVECPAITQSQARKFLRDVYNCIVEITPYSDSSTPKWKTKEDILWKVDVDYYGKNFEIPLTCEADFTETHIPSYEEALEIGIVEALKLIDDGTI